MIRFDPSEIVNWADTPDAQYKLPELVRRLILATVPMPSLIRMPSGSSVWHQGWDGLLVAENGNAWVPASASAWEISCDKNPKSKATSDYDKRSADPDATFIFVTPRRWANKSGWAKNLSAEGRWNEVRVLDADDLVAWLQQTPGVAHWFAREIGKLPTTGVIPLEEWWGNWSTLANPHVSSELVTAGRQDQAENLIQWFGGKPSHFYVQGDTRDEAIAFAAGCVCADSQPMGTALLARAVVVENADAWRSLEGHSIPLALVRSFSGGNVSPLVAVGRGHHVLTPLGEHEEPRGDGVTLPRLGREETLQELGNMGLSEARARVLVRSTARRLSIMRRRLVDDAGGPTPAWASSSTPRSLVALVLLGQWNDDHDGDKAIVAEMVGRSYEGVERDLAGLMSVPDSPLTKVGSRWRLTSHEEAWHLLAPRLTTSDVERFESVATSVFGAISPEFELPVEERYMANVYGKVLPHSGTLREGMARSLALMGTQPDRARNAEWIGYVPARVMSASLGQGKGWQIWATLGDSLAALAEASPEALLDAVERDLAADPSPFEDLFHQEGAGFFGGAPHTGLLWALERLSWSQDHFARVAKCLARLAEIDPGGQVANRPAASLRDVFLPWVRFSEASDEHRLGTLRMLLEAVPKEGWRVLIESYPSNGGVIGRHPPSWRPWAQDGPPKPTLPEFHAFVGHMTKMLINGVGTDAGRWADLVGIISRLPPKDRRRTIDLMAQRAETLREHTAAHSLWTRLKGVLHLHRSYPDAAWAMDADALTSLEAVYRKLTPADPVSSYAQLFDHWPDLPEGKPNDHMAATERIAEARRKAIRAAYESGGVSAILDIAQSAQEPHEVGVSVVFGTDPELAFDLAINYLGSTAPALKSMAYGSLGALYSQRGWKALDEAIARAKANGSTPHVLAQIYLIAPAIRETWNRLDNESREIRTAYWDSMWWPDPGKWNEEDLAYAIGQLLSVRRSVDTVKWLALEPLSHELVIQILEAVPTDIEASAHQRPDLDSYLVARLFERLDQSEHVADDIIARLEIPYLEILDHDRPQLALHRLVVKEPSLFADVITWAFRRTDGQVEEPADDQMLERRAPIVFNVLWKLRLLPGLKEDGSVDVEALSTWVNEARRMCSEHDRGDIGDEQIGQMLANSPPGGDGVWPCEAVRDLLDDLASSHVGMGFTTGKANLRGVTSRGAFDGGGQERSLVDKYRQDAAKIGAKRPFTAQLLRQLAARYEVAARWEDQRADWSDQFES